MEPSEIAVYRRRFWDMLCTNAGNPRHFGQNPRDIKIDMLKEPEPKEYVYDDFLCPISQEIMKEPVMAMDGFTYDRKNIEAWFAKKQTSPITNEPLDNNSLFFNSKRLDAIKQYLASQMLVPVVPASSKLRS